MQGPLTVAFNYKKVSFLTGMGKELSNQLLRTSMNEPVSGKDDLIPMPEDYFADGKVDLFDWWVTIPKLAQSFIETQMYPAAVGNSQSSGGGSGPMSFMQQMTNFSMSPLPDVLSGNMQDQVAAANNASVVASKYFTFVVETEKVSQRGERPDPGSESQRVARVDRKYSEFYVLEQKLLEFHEDRHPIKVRLPAKALIVGARNYSYLETKMADFEAFLQYLIREPFLRNSELIFSFLTSPEEFNTSLFEKLNLGRFVKS
ncbi:hypothetical protein Ciccas_007627, partial [Cichlidogyrus casuarinus]